MRVDTLADGRVVRTGEYAVTPWRTGALAVPDVALEVAGDDAARTVRTSIPALTVASVLPADTAGIEPKPARGVMGPSWAWSTIALLALLAALAVAGLVWWWRRRRPVPAVAAAPSVPPRERALALLELVREAGLLERGALKEFYSGVADAVRGYAAALDRRWGEDLTTTELLGRLRVQVGAAEAARLREILGAADQVKFARREVDRETALAEWRAARAWVARFDWPPVAPTEEAA